eukprot:m.42791 g.42791  ORF g.42791 m.42791 type:complete len:926 (-) comp6321_c0_seq1:159-2936(-)
MGVPTPNAHDSLRVPWLPTDGPASDKHIFFVAFGFFIAGLFAIAHWSYSRKEANVPDDQLYRWHFLGGKSYNAALGTLTLFTTIFSAVTIAGVPFEASITGFFAMRWLTSGVWIGIGAVTFVPRFYRIMGTREYDCPNDFVSDRFNNRILSIFTSLIAASSVFLYIIIQFYAISDLLPALSKVTTGEQVFDRNVTTWILAFVIIVCEWLGGFDAVTWTDLLQSIVLIGAFVAIPVTYGYYYGHLAGAGDSFGYDCDNYFVLNCSQQAFIDFGSPCSSAATASAFQTGCLAYSASYAQMHPAGTEDSEFFLPLTKVAESGCRYEYNKSLPTCTPVVLEQLGFFQTVPPTQWLAARPLYPVPGPYAEERAWADKQFNSPLPSYLGIDGRGTFSRSAAGMMSFNLLFFSLTLFPHWVMKAMSVKSDKEVRFAYATLSFATIWSVFPMILVGIAGSALLKGIHPDAGTEFFAIILDDLSNRGGGPEYIAAIGGVGAIAAMMSTVDSALISVTNLLSTDFLRNWLMKGASDKLLLHVCKVISLVSIIGCVAIALYDKKLNNDPNVYSTLIEWQSSLLWQILSVSIIALYWDLNAWACLLGQICGIATIVGMYVHRDSCHNWDTAYAWRKDSYVYDEVLSGDNHPESCETSTYFVEYHVWAAVVNVFVTCVLSLVFNLVGLPNTLPSLEIPEIAKRCGDDSELTLDTIHEIMDKEGTREPIKDPLSIVFLCFAAALTTFALPWYGDAYDNCDNDSYSRWQACDIAGAPCKQMCDVADMSLAPPLPVPALMTAASACLTSPTVDCSCPLQGGYFSFAPGVVIPTDPVANLSYSGTIQASLAAGGFSPVYDGTGNGKICEGYTLQNGIPEWANTLLICWIVAMFCVLVAWTRWGCIDDINKESASASAGTVMNPLGDSQKEDTDTFGFKATAL